MQSLLAPRSGSSLNLEEGCDSPAAHSNHLLTVHYDSHLALMPFQKFQGFNKIKDTVAGFPNRFPISANIYRVVWSNKS